MMSEEKQRRRRVNDKESSAPSGLPACLPCALVMAAPPTTASPSPRAVEFFSCITRRDGA